MKVSLVNSINADKWHTIFPQVNVILCRICFAFVIIKQLTEVWKTGLIWEISPATEWIHWVENRISK